MVMREIAPGLYRWSALHPEWRPGAEPDSPADWPQEVGSVACELPDALLVVDPQLPEGKEQALWSELDPLADQAGGRVHVLTTLSFHRRSRERFVERYGAATSRARGSLPEGVETIPIRRFGETMVWLLGRRALVPGDRLISDGAGGLRLCPESWLRHLPGRPGMAELARALRPLLDLPAERVLVSHGEPVLAKGEAAIAAALERAA
jgi:hypothetical protein